MEESTKNRYDGKPTCALPNEFLFHKECVYPSIANHDVESAVTDTRNGHRYEECCRAFRRN
jgi:hypothetical protein